MARPDLTQREDIEDGQSSYGINPRYWFFEKEDTWVCSQLNCNGNLFGYFKCFSCGITKGAN